MLHNYLMLNGEVAAHFGPGPTDLGGFTPPLVKEFPSQGGFFDWGGPIDHLVEQDARAADGRVGC